MNGRQLVVLFLGVCAAPVGLAAKNFVVRESPLPTPTVSLIDERSPKDLKGGLPILFDPTYSIPDKRFTPPLLPVLAAALTEKLGSRVADRSIVIQKLQAQNYFRKTYENNRTTSLMASAGLIAAAASALAIDEKQSIDAVRFTVRGTVDGKPFAVDLAAPYEVGKTGGGMVYNGPNATAATVAIVQQGIDRTVVAIEALLTDTAVTSEAAVAPDPASAPKESSVPK